MTELETSRIDEAFEKAGFAQKMVELHNQFKAYDTRIHEELQKANAKIEAKAEAGELRGIVVQLEELAKKQSEAGLELQELQQKLARPIGTPKQSKSPGELLVESQQFKDMLEGRAQSAAVQMKSFERKDITSAEASAGTLVVPERLGLVSPPEQPLLIRNLLMPGTTNSNALEYPREKLFTNNAAPVAELAQKPQSDITFEMVNTTVKTLAHWMYASKQIMDDAPQLASYINGRLIYGLKLVEEAQILTGDGTGQNLLGIIPQATAYDTGLETTLGITNKNKMDVLRTAMLQVQNALYPPSGIVLHPTDWAAITLTKDANGNYLIANPQSTVSQGLWSLPIVPSMSMEQGDFLVGAFRMAAQLFDREQANIAISYEDRDNFIKNAVTIRAEERIALAVYRPQAFVHGSFA